MRYLKIFLFTFLLVLGACCRGRLEIKVLDKSNNLPQEVDTITIKDSKGRLVDEKNNASSYISKLMECGKYQVQIGHQNILLHTEYLYLNEKLRKVDCHVVSQTYLVKVSNTDEEIQDAKIKIFDKNKNLLVTLTYPNQKKKLLPEDDYFVEIKAPGYQKIEEIYTLISGVNDFWLTPEGDPDTMKVSFFPFSLEDLSIINYLQTQIDIYDGQKRINSFYYPRNKTVVAIEPNKEYHIIAKNEFFEELRMPLTFYSTADGFSVTDPFIYLQEYDEHNIYVPMESIEDDDEIYEVTFEVQDATNKKRLDGVSITVDEINIDGYTVGLPEGEYSYKVTKNGYKTEEDTFQVNYDHTIEISLKKQTPKKDKTETVKQTPKKKEEVITDGKKGEVPVPFSKTRTYDPKNKVTFKLKNPNDRCVLNFSWTKNNKKQSHAIRLGKVGPGMPSVEDSYKLQDLVKEHKIKTKITIWCN